MPPYLILFDFTNQPQTKWGASREAPLLFVEREREQYVVEGVAGARRDRPVINRVQERVTAACKWISR